jgi:predicted secreted Zn-dependent protease
VGQTADCTALRNQVDRTARGILEAYRQKEKDYDVKTRHGATQGATLPGGPPSDRPVPIKTNGP